jgi:hypothetical protein
MTDEREPSGRTALDEPRWRHALLQVLDDALLDVRVLSIDEDGEGGFDFLLVHPEGARDGAIDRFAQAMLSLSPQDIPPHIILSADSNRAARPEFSEYRSIQS